MPLINGLKMACEPCIRGHRSTKCTHANERLMVPVRKPGRPLSTCPHVPGQSCGCGGVTAAIPRKQKCGCASGIATPTDSTSASSFNGEVRTPVTPPSPARASFRVQKAANKLATSRKSSVDAINLERMDLAQFNVFGQESQTPKPCALNSSSNGFRSPAENGAMAPVPYIQAFSNTFGPPILDGYAPPVSLAMSSAAMTMPSTSVGQGREVAQDRPLRSQSGGHARTKSVTANGALATDGNDFEASQQHVESVDQASRTVTEEETGESCCCSGGGEPKAAQIEPESTYSRSTSAGALLSRYQPPVNLAQPIYVGAFPSQVSLYTMPSPYGSVAFPLQPAQWRTIATAYGAAPPPEAFVPPPVAPLRQQTSGSSMDGDHQCGCGDGCECIGCAAHPYNDATQEYVRSAWSMQKDSRPTTSYADSSIGVGQHEAPPNSCCGGGGRGAATATAATAAAAAGAAPPPTNGSVPSAVTDSPLQVPTPMDSPSAISDDQQALNANDFFFVNYPFLGDGGCGGDTYSCPCGDDCQCLGCTIHNTDGLGVAES